MLYEIGKSLGVPASRFFEGLPGNIAASGETSPLPVEERIDFYRQRGGPAPCQRAHAPSSAGAKSRVDLDRPLGQELTSTKAKKGCEIGSEMAPVERLNRMSRPG